ncbi:hypothetical protein [Frankia sp. Cr2]|uniref:hypothetical protein n=1 Tax=Frankia sp. Cr2 TaxID=3073932 RepID=UPI002AD286BB|nr:hypothetical protein [Frankia sp. Cr2]
MIVVCQWCVEDVLVPIVGAPGYCSWSCQNAATGIDRSAERARDQPRVTVGPQAARPHTVRRRRC